MMKMKNVDKDKRKPSGDQRKATMRSKHPKTKINIKVKGIRKQE